MPEPPLDEPPAAFDRLIRRWPADRPLAALAWAGDGWSFIAEPRRTVRLVESPGCGPATVLQVVDPQSGACEGAADTGRDPLGTLEQFITESVTPHSCAVPRRFRGGWIGFLSYDLGRIIEPKAQACDAGASVERSPWPLLEFHHCPAGFLIDHQTGESHWTGDGAPPDLIAEHPCLMFEACEVMGDDAAAAASYKSAVGRIVEHIAAGDIFQANLAHRLTVPFDGSMRAAFLALHARSRPWYGAYLELSAGLGGGERRAILSVSPELFLKIEPGVAGRRITTRPMKGTRPAPPLGDAEELRTSPKDLAELTMIVDLMRNDLGRLCTPGTVRVPEPRIIEHHGGSRGVLQATARITGDLRADVGLASILRATFPPGSVTGAPKIRAMEIIDALEPAARGPYCGAIGWIAPGGSASFNVAIRTALVSGAAPAGDSPLDAVENGTLHYSVGAGIVADSTPGGEWEETLTKARVLGALQQPAPAPV